MVKKVALQSIVVVRDGEKRTLAPGKSYDFTAEEMKDFAAIEARHNKAQRNQSVKLPFAAIVRDPINESPTQASDVSGDEELDGDAEHEAALEEDADFADETPKAKPAAKKPAAKR